MSSNYPPGAEHDPNAPYNQEDPPEVVVTVTEKLVKQDVIYSNEGHYCCDSEFDLAEGRVIHTQFWDPGDVAGDWREQRRSAEQCLADASRVLHAALKERLIPRYYGKVNVLDLAEDCEGWEQLEIEIEESS